MGKSVELQIGDILQIVDNNPHEGVSLFTLIRWYGALDGISAWNQARKDQRAWKEVLQAKTPAQEIIQTVLSTVKYKLNEILENSGQRKELPTINYIGFLEGLASVHTLLGITYNEDISLQPNRIELASKCQEVPSLVKRFICVSDHQLRTDDAFTQLLKLCEWDTQYQSRRDSINLTELRGLWAKSVFTMYQEFIPRLAKKCGIDPLLLYK